MAGNKRSFTMSSVVAERPGVEPVQKRWRDTANEAIKQDDNGNLCFLEYLMSQLDPDAIAMIRRARKQKKVIEYDDQKVYRFDTGVDGVLADAKGNLMLENSALKANNRVAQLIRAAIKAGRTYDCADQSKKANATQAVPVQAATATSAPAEEVVVPAPTASAEPVQEVPEVDEPPALPAAAVASAPAEETAAEAAKKPFRSYWAVIIGLWVAMVAILAISWPVAVILAWVVAVVGFWFVGRNVYRFAPNWSPFIAIGWLIVTPWLALPTTSFIAKFMLPHYSAQAVVPATFFGTATLVWMAMVFWKLIPKAIGYCWKSRKNVVPFFKAVRAEPRLLKTKAAQIWAALKAAWKEKYPN